MPNELYCPCCGAHMLEQGEGETPDSELLGWEPALRAALERVEAVKAKLNEAPA